MIENTELLVDTNILVYAIDTTEEEKHEIAKKILTEGFKKSQKLCFSTQNLSEFFVVSTATIDRPIHKETALNVIKRISEFNHFKILTIKSDNVISAIKTHMQHDSSYWDSLIAETMKDNKVFTIITENEKDFKKIPWLIVINPFK